MATYSHDIEIYEHPAKLLASGARAGRHQEAVEIIRLLLAAGADPTITNKSGRKPADYLTDDALKPLLDPQP